MTTNAFTQAKLFLHNVGISLTLTRSGKYRVAERPSINNNPDLREARAHYTSNLQDAIDFGLAMAAAGNLAEKDQQNDLQNEPDGGIGPRWRRS